MGSRPAKSPRDHSGWEVPPGSAAFFSTLFVSVEEARLTFQSDRGYTLNATGQVRGFTVRPDAASELVEAYLKVNGYFVLDDLQIHVTESGTYRSVTDVDVIAIRPPSLRGAAHYSRSQGAAECLLAGELDPTLGIDTDRCDVIVGEVKRGEASLNPGLRDPRVLHAVARRVGDVFGVPVHGMIDSLVATARAESPTAQVRLVSFAGHGGVRGVFTVYHGHAIEWLNKLLARHRELFEVTVFSDPVLSLLSLAGRLGHPLASPVGASVVGGELS